MEEKTIVICEKSENEILGQLNVFGWKMKEKKFARQFLNFRYYQYTMEREEKSDKITETNMYIENRWQNSFTQWNQFMLKGFNICLIGEYLGLLMGIIGVIMFIVGLASSLNQMTIPSYVIGGLVIFIVGFLASIPSLPRQFRILRIAFSLSRRLHCGNDDQGYSACKC